MPHNTSNAGHAVANGKLYVAGGYTQPLCGYRPEVQVYSPRSGWSAPSSLDPPNRVGAYSCAVAAGKEIFFIGGWYPPSVYTSACREDRYERAEVNGRAGIIVAGGSNARDGRLSSVEYLDLGPDSSNIQFQNLRWRKLPDMSRRRAGRLVGKITAYWNN